MGGSKLRRYGSTGRTRTMFLAALGVVKVATPDQIRRLMCPGTKDAATVRGGLKDLEAEHLVLSPGSAVRVNDDGVRVTEKLWTLTPAEPPADPAPTVRPEGLGPLTAWSTEAVLPVAGTFLSPARGSVRADMVFASPGHDVAPLLFVEVDNGTEGPPMVADKIERYHRFFARRANLNGREVPLWRNRVAGHRTRWPPSGGAGVHQERRAARHADPHARGRRTRPRPLARTLEQRRSRPRESKAGRLPRLQGHGAAAGHHPAPARRPRPARPGVVALRPYDLATPRRRTRQP
ncbi:replication-relaxation family protein [Streptomyces sp. ID-01-6.2a]|uniref:Replication-relaxation family protein n=1 Tax=Streptomyces caniscabiei TaxID=2746961 RepID=A0A927LCD8_9ACTN|nr:replication-relaxation family protein [Streptomyces caniscabiei]